MEFARSTSGAILTGTFPILWGSEVALPKRPSAALPWTSRVNPALSRFVVEKHAVAVTEFFEASANTDFASVLVVKIFD